MTGKEAANRFADNYENVSNITISRGQQKEARREERERRKHISEEEAMELDLTLNELQAAIKQLKAKKSPGPDGITNEMLIHLGCFAMKTLLNILNLSWREGRLPQIWKEATMIPIPKQGKDKKKASSLTSVVGKPMERILNQRVKWYLETNQLLAH